MQAPNNALWIGSDHPFDLHECYLRFRRGFTLEERPRQAILAITADSRYRLWINGEHVARGPARCWPHVQQVDEIHLASRLRAGENLIEVLVYSPGYSHFAYVHRGQTGLLAWMTIDGETALVTDSEWQVARDRSWRDDVPRISIYGAGIERRRLAPVEFHWQRPRSVSPPEGPVWKALRPRDVPLLDETVTGLGAPWQFRRGLAANSDDPHEALRQSWLSARKAQPANTEKLGKGECAIWVFDMGRSATCTVMAEITGAAGGERLLLSYAEKLKDGDLLISDPATYCRMRPTDEFILRPGSNTAETFSQRGGRYLVFALVADQDTAVQASFAVRHTSYPLGTLPARFHPDFDLDRIAAMCRTTLLACLQDGFVDSVWRESSQWLGDCVAQAFALAELAGDWRPMRRAIAMAADGAYDDDVLPSVLPGEVHAYTIVDYNFSWIELLAMYGGPDREELIDLMRPVARKLLARFARDVSDDGLIRSQPGRRFFLDWSPVDRREPNLTYNGRYLHTLLLAHELRIDSFEAEIAALRQAITRSFFEGAWRENTNGTPASQLGLAFLLLTGCAADDAAGSIVDRSLDVDDSATSGKLVLASPFMHHYIFLALDRLGRRNDILRIIRARWGRWASAGEPTCWENWNVDFPDGSKCHGFSAHPLAWIIRDARQS